MLNEPHFFWKNFRLGTELQISGSFIYNALQTLDQMETFYYEAECFEFLYNVSVGLERLQKIAIILIEHDETKSQEDFEKSLITHNNSDLLHRIGKSRSIKIGKQHNKFLTILDNFYNTARYDRFNISSVYRPVADQRPLINWISDELKIEITIGLPFSSEVTPAIKKFVGKIIGKLSVQLYEIVRAECSRIGIYTYEVAYESKAFKIFVANEFDFEKEKLTQREICLFILKNLPEGGLKTFINGIRPLDFGQLHTNKYFESMFRYHKDRQVMDEMEYLYEENEIKYERVNEVMVIGSSINFNDIEEFGEK